MYPYFNVKQSNFYTSVSEARNTLIFDVRERFAKDILLAVLTFESLYCYVFLLYEFFLLEPFSYTFFIMVLGLRLGI